MRQNIIPFAVNTRRRSNVYLASNGRRIDVETTLCVYRVKVKQKINNYFQNKQKHQLKIGILKLMVTVFDKIHKEYLGTSKFAKTWKFSKGICLFKVNNRYTETRCEICSKLRLKTPKRRQWLLLLTWACKQPLGFFSKSIKGCFLLYLFWH